MPDSISCKGIRDDRIFFFGRIRIRILFVYQKIFESESEYYSRFLKRFEYIRISEKVRIFEYYSNNSVIFEQNVKNKREKTGIEKAYSKKLIKVSSDSNIQAQVLSIGAHKWDQEVAMAPKNSQF